MSNIYVVGFVQLVNDLMWSGNRGDSWYHHYYDPTDPRRPINSKSKSAGDLFSFEEAKIRAEKYQHTFIVTESAHCFVENIETGERVYVEVPFSVNGCHHRRNHEIHTPLKKRPVMRAGMPPLTKRQRYS